MTKTLITKTSDLSAPVIGPRHVHAMGIAIEAGAKIATVQNLISLLRTHSDPIVQGAASVIESTCVEPWIESLTPMLEGAFDVSGEDHYDLVLPVEGKATIGSGDGCDVQIAIDHVQHTHAKVTHRETNNDHTWVVTLERAPTRGSIGLKVGDDEITRRAADRDYGDGPELQVKPGDVIEIGLNKILLHMPTEPFPKNDSE